MALNMLIANFPGWTTDEQKNQFMAYLTGGVAMTSTSVTDNIDSWNRDQLKAKAKELKVKGITGMKKPELAAAIKSAMNSPSTNTIKPVVTKKDKELKQAQAGRELLSEFPDPRTDIMKMSPDSIPDEFSFRKAQTLCRLIGINCHKMSRADMVKEIKGKFEDEPDLIVEAPDDIDSDGDLEPVKESVTCKTVTLEGDDEEVTPDKVHTPVLNLSTEPQKRPKVRTTAKTTKSVAVKATKSKQILSGTTSIAELPSTTDFSSLIAEAGSGSDAD